MLSVKYPYVLLLLLVAWNMPAVPGTLVLQQHCEKKTTSVPK